MERKALHSVNVESKRYLQVNNCSFQTRTDGFTVTRSDGWLDYQLLLITEGECIAYHSGREYRLFPGGVVLYAPGEPQKYIFPKKCQSLWMHFSGTAVSEILDSCKFKSGVYQLGSDNYIIELFYMVIKRFNSETAFKYLNASVIELLCSISDRIYAVNNQKCPGGIYSAADYITKNYNEDFDICKLAEISGYSRSRFSYLFKHYMGKTAMEYQRDIRLNNSCCLLMSTNLSVSDIAYCCGYTDALYYSRIFKNKYKLSPTDYRNRYGM